MNKFDIPVTVYCETLEEAIIVAAERISFDEDYGFKYTIEYKTPVKVE